MRRQPGKLVASTLRRTALAVAVIAVASSLGACGKKGKLDPPDEDSRYPRTYPTAR